MARDKREEIIDLPEDVKPAHQETLNEFYTRKQRVTETELSGDGDAELVSKDDSFAESRNYGSPDAGPRNAKTGRKSAP